MTGFGFFTRDVVGFLAGETFFFSGARAFFIVLGLFRTGARFLAVIFCDFGFEKMGFVEI